MRLSVLFLQYDIEKYADAFEQLRLILEPIKIWDIQYLIIDNKHENKPFLEVHPGIFEVGGDNSVWEFSGWEKGLSVLEKHLKPTDLYLLVTDAFQAYSNSYRIFMNPGLLSFLVQRRAIAGWVDLAPSKYGALDLDGKTVKHWIRSSFMFISAPVMQQMPGLVSYTDVDSFCSKAFDANAFKNTAPLNKAYRKFLSEWLNTNWHSAFVISEESWEYFRNKLRSILNEATLTLKWQEQNIPIYDLEFLITVWNNPRKLKNKWSLYDQKIYSLSLLNRLKRRMLKLRFL